MEISEKSKQRLKKVKKTLVETLHMQMIRSSLATNAFSQGSTNLGEEAAAPAHSEGLADEIVSLTRNREEWIGKYATAVMAPWHGLFVVGKDIDAAFDLTERIDTNAYCILMSRLLSEGEPMDAETTRMKLSPAIKSFNNHHTHA